MVQILAKHGKAGNRLPVSVSVNVAPNLKHEVLSTLEGETELNYLEALG